MLRTELTVVSVAVFISLALASPVQADDSFQVVGQEVYDAYCGACHGFDGVPLLPNTPNFAIGERLEKSDDELLKSIRDGKGKIMPGWLGILSDEECEAVLGSIKDVHNNHVK
jgi:mono/diheme cytochrome c family protein